MNAILNSLTPFKDMTRWSNVHYVSIDNIDLVPIILRSDRKNEQLQSRQPTLVLATEAVEEVITFVARYILSQYNSLLLKLQSGRSRVARQFPRGHDVPVAATRWCHQNE